MKVLGWIMFGAGCVLLLLFGFVGMDTGGLSAPRLANIPGVLGGIGLMISGAIFAAVGYLIEMQEVWFHTLADQNKPRHAQPPNSQEPRPEGRIKIFKGAEIYRQDGKVMVSGCDDKFDSVLTAEKWIVEKEFFKE